MEIKASELTNHLEKMHERTRRLVPLIPRQDLEWAPGPGRFTFGDMLRHLAGIERWMYAEAAHGRPSRYPGHGRNLADGYDAVVAYYDRLHAESAAIFESLDDAALSKKVQTPDGAPITLWKWLRASAEHESHHRGQLYMMLGMRGVPTPPLFGLTEEQVLERSQK